MSEITDSHSMLGWLSYGKLEPNEWIRFADGSSQVRDKNGNILLVAGPEATAALMRLRKIKLKDFK